MVTLIILLLLGVIILVPIFYYNGFVYRRNKVKRAFATIDVQLKKRWDLIPPLVETAKAFAKHEKELLESVVVQRNQLSAEDKDLANRLDDEKSLSSGISRMFALAESYPELKSDTLFLKLQDHLSEIESQIAAARRAYNSAVMSWNSGVEMFPGSLFARVFGFRQADWFEMPAVERTSVSVDLG